MGFFDFFNKRDAEPAADPIVPPAPVDDVLLSALLHGETITREKVMTLPAVNGAVDFISNTIASMPVKLYKVKQGKVEAVEEDNRVKMLNGDTGDTLDAFQLKKAMVTDYLLGKGGYCFIRKFRNEFTGLFYVEDRFITIMKVYEPIYKQFQIYVGGYSKGEDKNVGTFEPYEFIKLLRNTKDGASGVGYTVEVSKALETAYQTLLYQLGMVSTGGNKKGFLKAQRKLTQEEIDTLKRAWRNLYGNNNSEKVVVLNNGVEFQEASATAVESQLNESKKTLSDEVNALFHIYPQDFERTFKEAIYPIVKAFETALNRDLLLEKEKKNHFFEFDVKEIVRVNIKERYEAYKLAKETGFMTLNEIRRSENMEWIQGLDVINVGLGAVLYDVDRHVYYTPNSDTVGDLAGEGDLTPEEEEQKTDEMLEGHELAKEFDASGNSSDA
jgi:HK97 family phage portal protein